MQNFGIKDTVLNEICSLAKKHGVNKVVLFGSRARGDYRRTSDIDLAAAGGNISEFMLDVDEQTSTLLKFDIIDLDGPMQKELMDSIEREGIVIYEKV